METLVHAVSEDTIYYGLYLLDHPQKCSKASNHLLEYSAKQPGTTSMLVLEVLYGCSCGEL